MTNNEVSPFGVVVKMRNCDIVVNEFQFRYLVNFWITNFGWDMNPFVSNLLV